MADTARRAGAAALRGYEGREECADPDGALGIDCAENPEKLDHDDDRQCRMIVGERRAVRVGSGKGRMRRTAMRRSSTRQPRKVRPGLQTLEGRQLLSIVSGNPDETPP